jgi:hypothetical protein
MKVLLYVNDPVMGRYVDHNYDLMTRTDWRARAMQDLARLVETKIN